MELSAETSIQSRISLALAVKLKTIFVQDGSFLSFPLGVLGFTYKALDFMKDIYSSGLSAQEQEAYKSNFARTMNLIPEESLRWRSKDSSFLWSELRNTLNNSTFASSVLTEEENSLLNQAIDFLTDETQVNGFEVPADSMEVTKYKYYAKAYERVSVAYINEKLAVEYSTGTEGEKLREQWASYREEQLKQAIQSAEQDWLNLGFKQKVEYYQLVRSNLEPKRYPDRYRYDYLAELNLSEIGIQLKYLATFFSPRDAFSIDLPWSKIDLTSEEIISLVQNAPDELKTLFDETSDSEDILSVSLEYNNVSIERPWFKPEFFDSRYWKLNDQTVISEGSIPNTGTIPAYITGFIAIRNIVIVKKKTSEFKEIVIPLISGGSIGSIRATKMKPEIILSGNTEVVTRVETGGAGAINMARNRALRPEATGADRSSFSDSLIILSESRKLTPQEKNNYVEAKYRGTINTPTTIPLPGTPLTILEGASVLGRPDYDPDTITVNKGDKITVTNKDGILHTVTSETGQFDTGYIKGGESTNIETSNLNPGEYPFYCTLHPYMTGKLVVQKVDAPDIIIEKVDFEGVIVLALICKRLPKCPNPDDTLSWNGS